MFYERIFRVIALNSVGHLEKQLLNKDPVNHLKYTVTMDGFSYEGNGAVTDRCWDRSSRVPFFK